MQLVAAMPFQVACKSAAAALLRVKEQLLTRQLWLGAGAAFFLMAIVLRLSTRADVVADERIRAGLQRGRWRVRVASDSSSEAQRLQHRHPSQQVPIGEITIRHNTSDQELASLRLGGLSSSVAMFAFAAKNNAGILPYALNNVKRLAKHFAKAYVLMVENDSTDNTVAVFLGWLKSVRASGLPIHGEVRSYKWNAPGGRDLKIYAAARNEYLHAISEQRYADVEYLVVLDTDMCIPWKVKSIADTIDALMRPQHEQNGHTLDAIYAYGACGWFQQTNGSSAMVPPYTPGAHARYCDLFALQAITGQRFVIKKGGSYPRTTNFTWREQVWGQNGAHADAQCSQDMHKYGCYIVNGEPIIPVRSAFGGLAVYRAEIFKHNGSLPSAKENSSVAQQICMYGTDADRNECEHVVLGNCLHKRGYRQGIAKRMVVSWEKEGCKGPVLDDFPQGMSKVQGQAWGDCPCTDM